MTAKLEGRPRDVAITRAIVDAATRQMETAGFGKLTVDGIVTEVGTTRQAFYRRYRNLSTLALEILLARFGKQDEVDTGSLEGDLFKLQIIDVAMMSTPLILNNLAGLLEEIQSDSETRAMYLEQMLIPRRNNVRKVLMRAQGRQEIAFVNPDSEFISDLLFGPLLARVLLPMGLPIDEALARQTVAAVLNYLR